MTTGYKNDLDEKKAADDRYSPEALREREKNNDAFDDITSNYDKTADDSQENENVSKAKNIDSTKAAEENPMNSKVTEGGRKQPIDFKALVRKKGPIAGIIALLGGGGILLTGFSAPMMLLMQITDVFTNNFNDVHTSITTRTNANIAHKISNARNSFSETSDGKCGIRCKHTTMSDATVRNLEARGFKVTPGEADAKFNRRIVQTLTFPDGTTVNNGNEFKRALRDPVKAVAFNRVFNSKTAFFLNTKFGSMIKSKLGINKAYKLAGESKEKFNESFRRALNLPPIDINAPTLSPEERVRANPRLAGTFAVAGRLGTRVANPLGGACLAHNINKGIGASLKVAKYSAYAAFAMTFLNAAHKLKAADGGGIDPLVVSELGDRITYTDQNKTNPDGSPNEAYGLSATDSYGYQAAAYGYSGTAPTYAKTDSMESSGVVGKLSEISFLITGTAVARTIAQGACSTLGGDLGTLLQCAPTAPGLITYIGCVAAQLLTGAAVGLAINAALPGIIEAIVNANLKSLDETTKGPELGSALYPGTAAILGGHASSYGMKAGTKDEIKNYIALGSEVRERDIAIAKVEAKDDQFNISNQYSFLGSMARNVNLASFTNTNLTTSAGLLSSIIPRSLAAVTTNAQAGTYMPVAENKANQYGNPDCAALNSIGVAGDAYCMPAYTKSIDELNADITGNIDFMIEGKYINADTGAPNDSPEGKTFQKFLDHCVHRVEALGETSKGIEEGDPGDYEWFIGAKCNEDTPMLNNFRIYAMDEPITAEFDGEESVLKSSFTETPTSGEAGSTDENSGKAVPGGWTFPTTAGASLSSPFGPRGDGYHTGIDLGVPSGSPFYATKDGTVLTREFSVYSIGNGSWCPVLGQMSDPIQKDIWITHEVNGVTYTSIYAHMSRFLKKTGDVVKAGDLIGYTGGSGCSSAPHVHFEIWEGNPTPSIPGPGMRNPWPLINP